MERRTYLTGSAAAVLGVSSYSMPFLNLRRSRTTLAPTDLMSAVARLRGHSSSAKLMRPMLKTSSSLNFLVSVYQGERATLLGDRIAKLTKE